MMEALEMIRERRSYRAFKPEPVTEEVMQKIVEAAGNCSSYTNTQPWEMVVLSGRKRDELSEMLYKLAEAHAPASPDIVLPTSWPEELDQRNREHGARRLSILGIDRDDKDGREKMRLLNFEFLGAPCAVFLFMDKSIGEWSLFDMGLFAQNLVLAAASQGLGSCIQASVSEYAGDIKKYLGMTEDKKLICTISMGYPDPDARHNHYRSLKKKPEEFFHWKA
jgi:nitroreductase